MPEQRPSVGTPVRVAVAPGCGDPWPGTVVPSAPELPADRVNVMAHGDRLHRPGSVVTVRLEQLALPDEEPGGGLPDNWAKFCRYLARGVADEFDLAPAVQRGIRQAFYRALQLAHSELPAVRARAHASGLRQAAILIGNLPDGTTAAQAARVLDAAASEARPPAPGITRG